MSRKPAVISVSQLEEATRVAVAAAVAERTIVLTDEEARSANGGAIAPTLPGTTMGYFPTRTISL